MRILTIECSSSVGSVSLTENDHPIIERSFENPRGRGALLFTVLEEVLADSGQFDLVLVGTGPGSYNALRSSIAAAWGIAKARKIQVQGLCSVLGYDAPEYFVVGDARSNQFFFCACVGGMSNQPDRVAITRNRLNETDIRHPCFFHWSTATRRRNSPPKRDAFSQTRSPCWPRRTRLPEAATHHPEPPEGVMSLIFLAR